MECTINGIPAWEHPKQMGCGAAADVISISTGSSSVSRGVVDDGTPPSSPQQRPSFLNLLPTRNSNANSKRHVSASSPNSNAVKGKVSAPTSPIRLPFHPSQQVAPTSPIRPPVHQTQSQRISSHAVAQQQHRTPNKSMDHRRMLNMDGYTSPNKMMISFDSDSQSCCPSVGDITWDHTEAMAFHNAATTKNSTASSHRQHHQQQQQQPHPWENFKEMKVDDTPTSTSRESSNHRSPIPPRNKNRVFPTTAVPVSAVAQQQQYRNKAPPSKPQQQRRNSVHNVVVTSTCPSIPDSTLLPIRPSNKTNEKSLSPVPRTNRRGSTGRPTPFTYIPSSDDASPLKPMSTIKPSSGIPNAPTVHTKENYRTEINVNFSDCFVSQKEDVPSIIEAESLSQRSMVGGKNNTASSSSVDSKTKSTTLPRKEIDVIHPITIVVPVREKRNEHLRTALPIPATSNRDDPLSGKTITTNSRSNSYGSNIIELPQETRDSNNSFTEKGHNSNQSSINTIPMSNLTLADALGNGDDQSDSMSKHSATSMERHQRQNYSHYQTTPNSKTNGNSRLNFDDVRKQSSRGDDGSFQKWNVSKSSVSTTSKSSKSATSQRSSPYNTVQQLEESIQNLEATLQKQTSDSSTKRRGEDNDDRLVNLALESSFNDIYLRPSISEKRMMPPHQHRQSSQESLSATSVSMFSSSMMSSSLLSNMSMNSNNSMLLRSQPVPPNMLIQINTISAPTNSNVPKSSKSDDYADIKTALAISSAIMDD